MEIIINWKTSLVNMPCWWCAVTECEDKFVVGAGVFGGEEGIRRRREG